MSNRVRGILLEEKRKAARKVLWRGDKREQLSRVALVSLGIFTICAVISPPSKSPSPQPLTDIERATAQAIAKDTNISMEVAEHMVRAHRPSAADQQRWAAAARRREAEEEALQLAFPN